LPKKNEGFDYLGVGGDFLEKANISMNGNMYSGPQDKSFLSYVKEGDSQLYGDYTESPKGKGRKGRPKISNNPHEFAIGLQAFGDSVMNAEISTGNAIRHGSKARKKRKERYEKEYQKKLKEKGLKEGPTLGRKLINEIKLRHHQRKTAKVLKKYYHPKEKQEREEKEEEPMRFKNQKRYR